MEELESQRAAAPSESGAAPRKTGGKMLLLIQAMVFLYSLVSMLCKIASGIMARWGLFSWQFILIFAGMILGLGIYAVLWQLVLKRVELTTAYANKGVTLLWGLVWSALLFHESIHWNNIVGVLVIILGIAMVTTDEQ